MKKEYDEIRFFCSSYFHYARHIFSTLRKQYWADNNNHSISEEQPFLVSKEWLSEEASLCLPWDSVSYSTHHLYRPRSIFVLMQFWSLFMLISQHNSVLITFALLQTMPVMYQNERPKSENDLETGFL